MLQPWPFELLAFIVGLCLGSFLNVCISRLPEHQSLTKPASHCPQCQAAIRWFDNIPLLSFLLLRARCRHCKANIPWRYPLVEFSTAVWFAFFGRRIFHTIYAGNYALAPYTSSQWASDFTQHTGFLFLGFLLIGLLVMDWQTHILPDAFALTGTAIGFVLTCAQALFLAPGQGDIHLHPRNNLRMSSPGSMAIQGDVFLTGAESLVLGRVGAILAAAGLILLIRYAYKKLRHREGLGLGDAKLMAMIAAFLGFWPAMLAFFVGIVLCAGYAVTLLARRRANALTRLPLGTFLCIGGLVAALLGIPLLNWYSSLL
jgi:leader peptidase (prepilin peptidase)/N-methyltransferase